MYTSCALHRPVGRPGSQAGRINHHSITFRSPRTCACLTSLGLRQIYAVIIGWWIIQIARNYTDMSPLARRPRALDRKHHCRLAPQTTFKRRKCSANRAETERASRLRVHDALAIQSSTPSPQTSADKRRTNDALSLAMRFSIYNACSQVARPGLSCRRR